MPFTKASQANPQLLLVDVHKSRVHPETFTWGTSCGVEVFLLPPHTTHLLCPLDTHFFRPLKQKWEALRQTQRDYLTHPKFVTLFGTAYLNSFAGAKGSNVAAGFHDSSLVPPQLATDRSTPAGFYTKGRKKNWWKKNPLESSPNPHQPAAALEGSQPNREISHTEPIPYQGVKHPWEKPLRPTPTQKVLFEGGSLSQAEAQALRERLKA